MSAMQDYKCPYCGGALEFNSSIQKMKCPFCDSEFEMEAQIAQDVQSDVQSGTAGGMQNLQGNDMSWDTQAGSQWGDGEADGLRTYLCEACGGEIVGDENTGAVSCPYCGSNIVMKGQFSGALRPDFIIPFKVDKKAAKEALLNHYKGKIFLPRVFKDQNHIDEIKGIYVPFWLFDANAYAEITYHTERVQHTRDADYEYTITDS
jgi:DNA-directed RNA polymerase subunit RPC12/RpoP